ncbi:toxin [Streptomyces viridochromogenes]|uniref:Toxin n=1 Tax=Streptomyces viridochromogenes TaxID=1938 RepID=A0A0J7Z4Y6_STRVR|nr:DUF397 domain-containing protein [Streptomyces viridochromogenes]KMS70567.1 toxin [Streptomyces viridochromogenes]KOG16176.1 toxin [Streptomyces viridochromogenes]KOG16450.1 toxin [Streptomyces viridochromogenes]
MSTSQLHWFKSSYSSSSDPGDCVEVALDWIKSSYSDSSEPGDCVEVATTPATIHIRDSKTPEALHLTVAPTTWTLFVASVSLA